MMHNIGDLADTSDLSEVFELRTYLSVAVDTFPLLIEKLNYPLIMFWFLNM